MSGIYRTSSGKWAISVGSGASRVRRVVGSKADAQAELSRLAGTGTRLRMGCTRRLHDYLEEVVSRSSISVSHNTMLSYRNSMKWIIKAFPDLFLDEIDRTHLHAYVEERLATGVRASTVNRELALVSKALSWALQAGLVGATPVHRARLKESPPPPRAFTPAELAALLEVSEDPLKAIVEVAVYTGMRHREVLRIAWVDVRAEGGRGVVMAKRKWKAVQVPVPLPEAAWRAIDRQPRVGPWVFPGRGSGPSGSCRTAFNAACRKSGNTWATFHNLRDTYATEAIRHGMDLVTLKEILGHSKMDMVLRYAQISDPRKAAASSDVGRKLAEAVIEAGHVLGENRAK